MEKDEDEPGDASTDTRREGIHNNGIPRVEEEDPPMVQCAPEGDRGPGGVSRAINHELPAYPVHPGLEGRPVPA